MMSFVSSISRKNKNLEQWYIPYSLKHKLLLQNKLVCLSLE
jgi:hypothetical protein